MIATFLLGMKILSLVCILGSTIFLVVDYFLYRRWSYEKRPWLYALGLLFSFVVWSCFLGWLAQL